MTTQGLQRFVEAQQPVYDSVCTELKAGRKTSHWMWFIFPQLKELGRSNMARYYGIESLQEAREYGLHPVLGERLRECTELVLAVPGKTAHEIFGTPDELKFRSCMTLFAQACVDEPVFVRALVRFFNAKPDSATLDLLSPRA